MRKKTVIVVFEDEAIIRTEAVQMLEDASFAVVEKRVTPVTLWQS
jgi:hypothetical protein